MACTCFHPHFYKDVQLIGAPSGWGAQIRGCEEGPLSIKKDPQFLLHEWELVFPKTSAKIQQVPLEEALPLITEHNQALAKQVAHSLSCEKFPLIIGGDHSIAIGTWNGVRWAIKEKSDLPLGLIWIDAHMDAHTPETSPSGAWHGMPLAALLGYGNKEMAHLKRQEPVLQAENLCLLGVRSFEAEEAQLLKDLNVRMYSTEDIQKEGIQQVLQKAVEYVSKNTAGFGVSLDLDVFDPEQVPGVGSPEKDGVDPQSFLKAFENFCQLPEFLAFEIVEYNPEYDQEGKTHKILQQCIQCFLSSAP